jgi:hypothetical protein
MLLTEGQKQQLYNDGYVKLPGVVPTELVDAALWAINNSLGENGIRPDQLDIYRSQTYCPELTIAPVLLDLVNKTPLLPLVDNLFGAGKIAPLSHCQIALRFPNTHSPEGNHNPHLDGFYTPTNGVPKGKIMSFTGLIGVYLSSVQRDWMSNFAVWPGSHHQYEAHFRQRGRQALNEEMPELEMQRPMEQLYAEPGDAVLCHYALGHTVVANSSPHIRYAVYFRIWHTDYADTDRWDCLTDIWREWVGLHDVIKPRNS